MFPTSHAPLNILLRRSTCPASARSSPNHLIVQRCEGWEASVYNLCSFRSQEGNSGQIRMSGGRIPQRGEIAPDFTLPDSTGQPRTLAQLVAERPRVLIFYRGHW